MAKPIEKVAPCHKCKETTRKWLFLTAGTTEKVFCSYQCLEAHIREDLY